ncbi:TPA: pyroglutamyl-peptidase I, partial [Enterococcus faecium]|nr:pyroglutamyl-peptidase I [Enterococcus faecium]HBK6891424.1 pyroglutamyl-peptidase I [Enterococcus faecium]
MKVLVTGFDPFGGDKVNPAYEAVKKMPDEISGAEIIKVEVPTVFEKSSQV